MSDTIINRRFKRWSAALISAATVGAVALPLALTPAAPAKAQAWLQIGPFGVGVGDPYPYNYGYYPYYSPHYGRYYGPYYNGYSYYSYYPY